MPIKESEMTLDEMKSAVKDEVCGECGGSLSVAWGNSLGFKGYILRCQDINHSTITRHKKQSAYEIQAEKEFKEVHKMDSKSLTTMTETQMMTRISSAKFPQELTAPDRKALALAAITYGFDPLMGEISIFQGRPFVSIDGRYRKAQETGKLDGVRTRPATKQERADWEIPDGDYFFLAEVYVKGSSMPFQGWGRVRAGEINVSGKFKPVDTNPQRMAEKRAEAQALRKAFHINLPSIETIGTEDEEPSPVIINGKSVIESTGEIKETAPTTTANEDFDNLKSASQKATESEKQPGLMSLEFKNLGEFYTACLNNFKISKSTVDKEISMYDLTKPDQHKKAWQQIVGTYQKA